MAVPGDDGFRVRWRTKLCVHIGTDETKERRDLAGVIVQTLVKSSMFRVIESIVMTERSNLLLRFSSVREVRQARSHGSLISG